MTRKNFTFKGRNGDNWKTPDDIYNKLNDEFNFNFDPCPLNPNPNFNGLILEWGSRTFVNPPYSNVTPWIEKAISEAEKGKIIVMLLKFDCSTKWFNELIWTYSSSIRLVPYRIHFNNLKPATFCSMVCIFNKYSFERDKVCTRPIVTILG
jgi:phage N-6-adenine-methyltransferase